MPSTRRRAGEATGQPVADAFGQALARRGAVAGAHRRAHRCAQLRHRRNRDARCPHPRCLSVRYHRRAVRACRGDRRRGRGEPRCRGRGGGPRLRIGARHAEPAGPRRQGPHLSGRGCACCVTAPRRKRSSRRDEPGARGACSPRCGSTRASLARGGIPSVWRGHDRDRHQRSGPHRLPAAQPGRALSRGAGEGRRSLARDRARSIRFTASGAWRDRARCERRRAPFYSAATDAGPDSQ